MAGGEGGFSTKAMGFDKKEVNDYIANLNQRMKEIEAEKKVNDEKTQAALKKAQEADAQIKAVKDDSAKRIADLELQLKTERRNEENLLIQIDDLKRKLKQSGGSGAGAGNTKAAEKKAEEIIAKANSTAKSIVDKANAAAKDTVDKAKTAANRMVSEAQAAGAGSMDTAGLDEFMNILGGFIDKVTSGVNEVNRKASELLGAKKADPVTVPDFSNVTAPRAEAPKADVPKAAPAPKTSEAAAVSADDLFALLEDDDASNDENDLDMITEVQPLDDPLDSPGAVVLDEFDLSESNFNMDLDAPVTEVKPINSKKRGKADLSDDFEKQILAQTAHSSSLQNDIDEDMLAAVRQQEEHFAVKPTDDSVGDLSMGSSVDDDPLAAMLKQAEIAFGGAGSNASAEAEEEREPKSEASQSDDSSNPWAALQNELLAMEKSGNLGDSGIESDTSSLAGNDPAVPSADDSAIWDFGDNSSGSFDDDDMGMSSDLFGNL